MKRVSLVDYRDSMSAWHEQVALGHPVFLCNDVRSVDVALLVDLPTGRRLQLSPDRAGQSRFGVGELRSSLTQLLDELEDRQWQSVLITTSGTPLLYLCDPSLAASLPPELE